MNRIIIAVLLVVALVFALVWQMRGVYVVPGEEHVATQQAELNAVTGDKMYYFWTSKRNREFFRIGENYQLQSSNETTMLSLFSVTYASLRPAEIKLGFYLTESEHKFTAAAPEYRVHKVTENYITLPR